MALGPLIETEKGLSNIELPLKEKRIIKAQL